MVVIINIKRNKVLSIEDKFFTPHGFILLATRTMLTLSWILEKSLLKPEKAHIYIKKASKPMVQAHSTSSHFWLMI